ncbi:MAG: hypothetical protein H6734_28195, partial [Alphaproteobacteria bacterium]|nr:hypothetical protein [Alphaproteobacteria bacterium]
PPTPLYAAPLDGRGTLHEAGELVYLAGGEPGFDGILHELGWSSERTIELPLPGLTPDRMPAFSGSTDGRLWSLVIEPTGVASVRVWDPVASAWSLHSVVPPDIVGADEATLAVDPTVHAVNDLAIYGSSPVLATYRTVPTGVRLVVVAWDGSGWVDVGEPLNGLREETEACLPHETGNVPPHPACERGEGRYAVLGLREVEDVPASARLLTTDDAIYVRYDTDDGLTLRSQVAGFHLPEVGP